MLRAQDPTSPLPGNNEAPRLIDCLGYPDPGGGQHRVALGQGPRQQPDRPIEYRRSIVVAGDPERLTELPRPIGQMVDPAAAVFDGAEALGDGAAPQQHSVG